MTTPKRNEAVAWYTDGHENDKSATTWDPVVAARWEAKGWPVYSLHKGIDYCALEARISALQGEVSRLRDECEKWKALYASMMLVSDVQQRRIDRMEAKLTNLEPPTDGR